jgi:large subunit ribosomal protein L6
MPIPVPTGVEVNITGQTVLIKGPKGEMRHDVHPEVAVACEDGVINVSARNETASSNAQSGTARALLNNMVTGCGAGFTRKLEIVGVGYRAQVQGPKLNLSLGYSHPVEYPIPEGITIETPSQTEILIKGADKQQVGQVAANIRAYRAPEPYKGKGVRYGGEVIVKKEAKKS